VSSRCVTSVCWSPQPHDRGRRRSGRTPTRPSTTRRRHCSAILAFYGVNGLRLTLSNDEAYDLVMAVAVGTLDDVEPIAERLGASTARWH
jgi:hypothetical protein